MLRITTHESNGQVTLEIEGKLAGPWVEILRDCWEQQSRQAQPRIQVDVRAVTFVDAAGKALLAKMFAQNAQFIAGDCQMKAILAEVEHANAES